MFAVPDVVVFLDFAAGFCNLRVCLYFMLVNSADPGGCPGIKMFSIILLLLDNWRLVLYITFPL